MDAQQQKIVVDVVSDVVCPWCFIGQRRLDSALAAIPEIPVGMDAPVVTALLATENDREAVANEAATASRMGITGVPCFLLEGKYAVMGAQESATLADAIRQVAAAKARGELDSVE